MTRTVATLVALASVGHLVASPDPPYGHSAGRVAVVNVEGTVWQTTAEGPDKSDVRYRFLPRGILEYSYNGNTYRDGVWEQRGAEVYFHLNQKYRECRAKIIGRAISGPSWNKAGAKWATRMTPANRRE